MNKPARRVPAFLDTAVIYQIFLRTFTKEGTLDAARKMLPHLKKLGATIAYLCPVTLADDDMRKEFWSPRQMKSKLNNPQNPYRIKDYFQIDPEYGNDADLAAFVKDAHRLGLRVILDLVYFHCGPSANIIKEHPGFVRRNPDGSIKNGVWCFPELNFENPALREYLWGNMEYFVKKFGVDGYRIDVGTNMMPRDFFEEAHRRLEKLNPDIIVLGECEKPEDQLEAFDMNYGYAETGCLHRVFFGGESVGLIPDWRTRFLRDFPQNARVTLHVDNHDTANDSYEERADRKIGPDGKEALVMAQFAANGVPMLYNGEEIGDCCRHSIWGNRFHGKNLFIEWERALTPAGEKRFRLYRKILTLRKNDPLFRSCEPEWIAGENDLIAWKRTFQGRTVLEIVNPRKTKGVFTIKFKGISAKTSVKKVFLGKKTKLFFEKNSLKIECGPYGYLTAEI